MALGGGLAVLLSALIAIGLVTFIYADMARDRVDSVQSLIGLGIASVLALPVLGQAAPKPTKAALQSAKAKPDASKLDTLKQGASTPRR